MQDNPFAAMLNIIKESARALNSPPLRIGEVISTAPLKVDVAGTPQDGSTIQKNAELGNLSTGDRVLLACLDDDQRFIILCKVARV
ncbi:MAG TPA: hypothetical protein IAD07_04245 [Candidatus Fimivicinus intestinavium]|nr:hypothetical protein [Candidatus Fimivicinus intestinavium]